MTEGFASHYACCSHAPNSEYLCMAVVVIDDDVVRLIFGACVISTAEQLTA